MIGTLFTNSTPIYSVNGFYSRSPSLPSRITTPIVLAPTVNTGQSRVSPVAPSLPQAILHPSIITTMLPATISTPAPTAPSAPATTTPSGTADSGATGATAPAASIDRLAGLLSSMFQPQSVSGGMAPVTFGPTDTQTSATTTGAAGGSNMGVIAVVLAVMGAGIWYYIKHR